MSAKLNTQEAANYLGLSKSKMDKMRGTGGGPKYYKFDARIVYDVADLEAWALERTRLKTDGAYGRKKAPMGVLIRDDEF